MRQIVQIPLEVFRELSDQHLIGLYDYDIEDDQDQSDTRTGFQLPLTELKDRLMEDLLDWIPENKRDSFTQWVADLVEGSGEQVFQITSWQAVVVTQNCLWPANLYSPLIGFL